MSGKAVLEIAADVLQDRVTSAVAALNADPLVRCNGWDTGEAACAVTTSSNAAATVRHAICINPLSFSMKVVCSTGTIICQAAPAP